MISSANTSNNNANPEIIVMDIDEVNETDKRTGSNEQKTRLDQSPSSNSYLLTDWIIHVPIHLLICPLIYFSVNGEASSIGRSNGNVIDMSYVEEDLFEVFSCLLSYLLIRWFISILS